MQALKDDKEMYRMIIVKIEGCWNYGRYLFFSLYFQHYQTSVLNLYSFF